MVNPYNSKLLLFGEHTILLGGMALALPLKNYFGNLMNQAPPITASLESNKTLLLLAQHIKALKLANKLHANINLTKLYKDIDNFLYFDSNIPQGYGLGSSGALVAAIYKEYSTQIPKEIPFIQSDLALIEGYFHGKSSGLDPLVVYLNTGVLINNNKEVQSIELNNISLLSSMFLIDTKQARKTAPLVSQFIEKLNIPSFKHSIENELKELNKNCINQMLNNESITFFKFMRLLSQYQLKHFSFLIPHKLINYWEQGLQTDTYYLKLCGAGGGGFILGFINNNNKKWNNNEFEIIYPK